MTAKPLEGRTVLIIEDDYLVGETLVELLSSAGALVMGPIGWIDEAMEFAADTDHVFDAAILDINLHGVYSYPVADVLASRHIGVVFASGYGSGSIDAAYRHHAHCTKPFVRAELLSALQSAQ
jgi:CheY-like chemotaxis protein